MGRDHSRARGHWRRSLADRGVSSQQFSPRRLATAMSGASHARRAREHRVNQSSNPMFRTEIWSIAPLRVPDEDL